MVSSLPGNVEQGGTGRRDIDGPHELTAYSAIHQVLASLRFAKKAAALRFRGFRIRSPDGRRYVRESFPD